MEPVTRVVVTDIEMRFGSMVVFMLKWSFAVIPDAIIITILWLVGATFLTALVTGTP